MPRSLCTAPKIEKIGKYERTGYDDVDTGLSNNCLVPKFDLTSKRGQVKCRCKLMFLPIWSEEYWPVVCPERAVFAPLYSMVLFIMPSICGYWFLGFLPVMMFSAYAISEIFCCLDQNLICCMSRARREIRIFENQGIQIMLKGQHCRTKHLLGRNYLLTPSIMHFRPWTA